MRRIRRPMHRYGEPDFDAGYLRWGLHDRETQLCEAESVLAILRPARPLRILDLACGIGTHAIHWAAQGHIVTGVDISQTFVREARAAAARAAVSAGFFVADVRHLEDACAYDVVTWIESSFFDEVMVRRIYGALRGGGVFVTDVRNPEHPRTRARSADWRTWREEGGVFCLERHETDPGTGRHEDVWITIDPERDLIDERVNVTEKPLSLPGMVELLRQAGFDPVELVTLDGEVFTGGEEPYWLWLVARKPEAPAEAV